MNVFVGTAELVDVGVIGVNVIVGVSTAVAVSDGVRVIVGV